MKQARQQPTAILLQNGKVLVSGGSYNNGALSDAELYDPLTRDWTDAGTMNDPRAGHEALLLANGTVLVVGGTGNDLAPLASAELYDPTKNAWTPTGALTSARAGSATVLHNGMVLSAGGEIDSNGDVSARSEIYDPRAGLWSITADMNQARRGHTVTLLQDGNVLVAGGTSLGGILNTSVALSSAETYDPASGRWATVGSLAETREIFQATLLQDGKVLVTGGVAPPIAARASVELYDPASRSWSQVRSMAAARWLHTSTLLPDGKVLVAGGTSGYGMLDSVATAEVYDPSMDTWSTAGSLVQPRWGHAATLLQDGSVLVEGGSVGTNSTAAAEIYGCF